MLDKGEQVIYYLIISKIFFYIYFKFEIKSSLDPIFLV